MGFFSWNCKHCGKEILAPYPSTKWSQAVSIDETDRVLIGQYDGYGRISGVDIFTEGGVEIYHEHCWEEAGSPEHFSSASDDAVCQGYFIDNDTLRNHYPIEGGWKFVRDCQTCDGLGYVHLKDNTNDIEKCETCDGKGFIPDE